MTERLRWMQASEVTEPGSYLKCYPSFGFVPQSVLVVKTVDGLLFEGITKAVQLDSEYLYLGPLPLIPPEKWIDHD